VDGASRHSWSVSFQSAARSGELCASAHLSRAISSGTSIASTQTPRKYPSPPLRNGAAAPCKVQREGDGRHVQTREEAEPNVGVLGVVKQEFPQEPKHELAEGFGKFPRITRRR
jgi:hypothetical protein